MSGKVDDRVQTKVVIPTVVPNEPLYVQPQFYAVTPGFTPYIFGVMFGRNYGMN